MQDYDLYVNDTEIGRGQSFDYASESRYQGWDITDAVKKDEDQINVGALIRTYGGGQGRAAVDAGFLAHINIFYTDGTVQTVVTDNTWKVSGNTPFAADGTKRNSEGDFVEKYDAQEAINFTGNNFDDSSWTAATEITADKIPTDTPIAELSKPTAELVDPVSVTRLSDGTITPPEKIEYRTPAPNGISGSDDPDTSTYTWTIGNSTDNLSTYSDTSDYADLTIGLGTGDSLSEYEGIKFGGTAVPDSGSVTDRYLLVDPKRDGTFIINVTGGGTSNNRVYYYDFENIAVDLSKCTKESGSIAKQLNPNTPTDVTINMKAGHKYVVYPYTNKGGGTVSAISYKYTDTDSEEQVDNSIPYEEPEDEKPVAV